MNKYRRVMGGTPTGAPLCRTCRHAQRMKGEAESQSAVFCKALQGDFGGPFKLEWEAFECSAYDDVRVPYLHEMKQIAWQLRTDGVTKKIVGFVSPQTMTEQERRKWTGAPYQE